MPYIGQSPTQSAFVVDTFSGNGSTTAFTMSVAPANTASVLVAVSGVLQDPSTYSVTGLTLTFSAAPPTGTANISVRYLGIPASGVTTTAYSTRTEFTATASQTTFTPPSYTVGFIQVYRNGVLLGSADYTATNGTTVVLAVGATSGDLVTTISFLVSSVLNAIPNTPASVGTSNLVDGAVSYVKLLSTDWTNSKTASGYQKLPSGIIIQWGTTPFNVSGIAAPTFPIAFPTSCLFVNASVVRSTTLSGYLMSTQVGSTSTTSATIYGSYTTGASVSSLSSNESAAWIAIGY